MELPLRPGGFSFDGIEEVGEAGESKVTKQGESRRGPIGLGRRRKAWRWCKHV